MANLTNLQNALNASSGKGAAAAAEPSEASPRKRGPHAPRQPAKSPVQAGRAGRELLSAYLPGDFKKSVRLIQAKKPDLSLQDLMGEAFNDLFSKYNVPTVSE